MATLNTINSTEAVSEPADSWYGWVRFGRRWQLVCKDQSLDGCFQRLTEAAVYFDVPAERTAERCALTRGPCPVLLTYDAAEVLVDGVESTVDLEELPYRHF
jgi:hypothetical protein